jgi:PhnB protein
MLGSKPGVRMAPKEALMKLSIHLTYGGQCEAAFRFYERSLDGAIVTMLKYGASPMAADVPPDWREKIVHATLTVGENVIAGADLLLKDYEPPKGFFALLDIDDPTRAERVFDSLSENGTVRMPIQETFWASRFGVLVDQFGIPWEINCGRPG